jgi:hypothetical protein
MTNFSTNILDFFFHLKISASLPPGVEVLNPYQDEVAFGLCRQFYNKYYSDEEQRHLILGINPGRLGGGLTGIPFTDPVKLERYCGIPNSLPKKTELSADFMYSMINAYGGPEDFYCKFYFSSVSPLGFVKEGKNLNYYDIRSLQECLRPFIVESLEQTLKLNINRAACYCLGEGQNFKFLNVLNAEFKWFERIVPLSHPRFIMQYKRKKVNEYIGDYLSKLRGSSS